MIIIRVIVVNIKQKYWKNKIKCYKNKEKCSRKISKYFLNVGKCDLVSKNSMQRSLWCNQNLIWITDLQNIVFLVWSLIAHPRTINKNPPIYHRSLLFLFFLKHMFSALSPTVTDSGATKSPVHWSVSMILSILHDHGHERELRSLLCRCWTHAAGRGGFPVPMLRPWASAGATWRAAHDLDAWNPPMRGGGTCL